jgi:hypothetical protein
MSIAASGIIGFIFLYLVYIKNMDKFLESISRLPSESLFVMSQNIIRLKTMVKVIIFSYLVTKKRAKRL